MDNVEKHIESWVPHLWAEAELADSEVSWTPVCEALYGAVQACNQVGMLEDYDEYRTLLMVARERRMSSLVNNLNQRLLEAA